VLESERGRLIVDAPTSLAEGTVLDFPGCFKLATAPRSLDKFFGRSTASVVGVRAVAGGEGAELADHSFE
jgi:hypothetical protein